MTERQGVEIDYCPKCRGVWLDRGELDKIIDRGASYEVGSRPAEPPRPREDRRDDDHRERNNYQQNSYHSGHSDNHHEHPRKRKREGFLGDLFDFGD